MLESETHHKDKVVKFEDNAGGRHARYTSADIYRLCLIVEEEPTEETKKQLARSRGEP